MGQTIPSSDATLKEPNIALYTTKTMRRNVVKISVKTQTIVSNTIVRLIINAPKCEMHSIIVENRYFPLLNTTNV